MTKDQKQFQDLVYRLSEIAEQLEYKRTRPLIRLNPKFTIGFLFVLDIVFHAMILYKLL